MEIGRIEKKIDTLVEEMKELKYEMTLCSQSGQKMDRHIDRIEGLYKAILGPFKRKVGGGNKFPLDDIV